MLLKALYFYFCIYVPKNRNKKLPQRENHLGIKQQQLFNIKTRY
jgi:hypothetical protein